MRKFVLGLVALLSLAISPAQAQNCAAYPFTLTNGTTADANQVMANFNLVRNCANNNLAHNAANSDITSLSGLTTPLPASEGGTGTTAGAPAYFASVAAFRLNVATGIQNAILKGYYTIGDGGGGVFSNTGGACSDDGGMHIVDGIGGCYVRVVNNSAYSVKWFGAKGDNAANDTTAVQAADTYICATGGGAMVFPPGTYRIGSPSGVAGVPAIPMCTNLEITGPGAVIKAITNQPIIGNCLNPTDMYFVNIHDIEIDGQRAALAFPMDDANGNGICLAHVSYSTVERVYIHDVVFNSILGYDLSFYNLISHNRILNTGKTGVCPAFCTWNGIFLDFGPSGWMVVDNLVDTTLQYGIWLGAGDADNFDNVFLRNTVIGTTSDCIRLADDRPITAHTSSRAIVMNNFIASCGQAGIRLQVAAPFTGAYTDVLVTGNVVRSATAANIIVAAGVTNTMVTNNHIENSASFGLSVAATNTQIIGNYFNGNVAGAMLLAGTGSCASGGIGDGYSGTFVPTVQTGGATGRTYVVQDGTFSRTCNLVNILAHVQINAIGSSTGALTVSLLPFQASATGPQGKCVVTSDFLIYAGQLSATINQSATVISIQQVATNIAGANLTETALMGPAANSTALYLSCTYNAVGG